MTDIECSMEGAELLYAALWRTPGEPTGSRRNQQTNPYARPTERSQGRLSN